MMMHTHCHCPHMILLALAICECVSVLLLICAPHSTQTVSFMAYFIISYSPLNDHFNMYGKTACVAKFIRNVAAAATFDIMAALPQ